MSEGAGCRGVDILLLGDLEVRVRGVVLPITANQQRLALAAMALAAPAPIPAADLIETLWLAQAPSTARTALHNVIRRLRAGFSVAGAGEVIETEPGGYRLALPPDRIDVIRFRTGVAGARARSDADDIVGAVTTYATALDLWRGDPIPDLVGAGRLSGQIEQLLDARLAATEELVDLELGAGHGERWVPVLRHLVEQWPLRESMTARLMLALHASGRTADALNEYAHARALLIGELGVEPGVALREAHHSVLTIVDEPTAGRRLVVVTPAQLPAAPTHLHGRDAELAILDERLERQATSADPPLSRVISGPAGVGKSALAVQWARCAADDFPDGQLFVNLRGFDPQASPLTTLEAVRGFLTALGVSPSEVPLQLEDAIGLYRSLLRGRRILVVLDNARDATQARPLLPTEPGNLGLVTSRSDLTGLSVTHPVRPLRLGLLAATAARRVVAEHIGADRLDAEPQAAADIVAMCGGLPLALAIVGAQLATRPRTSLHAFADELRKAASVLDVIQLDDPLTDLRAVSSWSVKALNADQFEVFRMVGSHPGPEASVASIASMTGRSRPQTAALLRDLCRVNLVLDRGDDRFGCHDLIRAHAVELARAAPDEHALAARRLISHVVHSAFAATRTHFTTPLAFDLAEVVDGVLPEMFADIDSASGWLEREQPVLSEIVDLAAVTPGQSTSAWQLGRILSGYLWEKCRWHDMIRIQRAALGATEAAGDRAGEADSRHGLADAYAGLEDFHSALTELDRALELFIADGDKTGESDVRATFGRILETMGSYAEAISHCIAALDIYREIADRSGEAVILNNVGYLNARLGNFESSVSWATASLELYRELDDLRGQTFALDTLSRSHLGLGDVDKAIDCLSQSTELSGRLGQDFSRALSLTHLGEAWEMVGDHGAARSAYVAALGIFDSLAHRRSDEIRRRLSNLEGAAAIGVAAGTR